MNNEDRAKIEKIIQERKEAHHSFLANHSKVYEAFIELEKRAFNPGDLSQMHKELIAAGISVVINCESCMEWHIHQALLSGATEKQILEAIEVGIEMGGGPATVSSRFALKVLAYYRKNRK